MTGELAASSRVRTVFLGSGGFGRQSLRRLADHPDVELVGVVTAPPRPAGRRQRPQVTTIWDIARELGVPSILTPERLRAPESIDAVLALAPDLLVLADYGQIVPPALLEVPLGALNLHPSLLPRHRGAAPISAAILAGDRETGITLMRMDAGLDTGPIVAQTSVALDGIETTPELEATLTIAADGLLERSLGPWIRGELEARPQSEDDATLTRPLSREDGRLDPRRSAVELERQVRAYQPWPGSFVDTPLGRVVIWAAAAESDPHAAGSRRGARFPGARFPGGTFEIEGLRVGDDERLNVREVQPAGGKRMTWEAFVRGHPTIVGSRVVPGPGTDLR